LKTAIILGNILWQSGHLQLPEIKHANILTNIQHYNQNSAFDGLLAKFPL